MFRLDCFLHGNCIENPRGDGKTLRRENIFFHHLASCFSMTHEFVRFSNKFVSTLCCEAKVRMFLIIHFFDKS